MTGAVLGLQCFNSVDDAADAYFSGAAPSLVSGSISYLTRYDKEIDGWHQKHWSIDSGGVATLSYDVAAVIPSFPECDPAGMFLDGVSVGWGITAVVVAVACLKLMQEGTK